MAIYDCFSNSSTSFDNQAVLINFDLRSNIAGMDNGVLFHPISIYLLKYQIPQILHVLGKREILYQQNCYQFVYAGP